MPYPSPTSLTLNDLLYLSLDPAGAQRTVVVVLPESVKVSDVTRVSENVVLNLPGLSYSVDTSDFLNTSENTVVAIDTFAGNQFSIAVSDTTATSEFMQTLRNGAWDLKTSSSTTTSENVVVTPPA